MKLLLLATLPSATVAFQTCASSNHIARLSSPNDCVASPLPGTKILHTQQRHQHTNVKSRRIRQSSSLNLFGWNEDEKEEEEAIVEIEEEEEKSLLAKSLPFLKVAFPSFLAGGVATLSFLFLPLLTDYYEAFNYGANTESTSKGGIASTNKNNDKSAKKNEKNSINQPVILFETILNNLNEAYVDDVDVQKLFETGVKAMTASLDPYTEFESQKEAVEMQESVSGKYGGVGLVIRGGTKADYAEFVKEEEKLNNDAEKVDGSSGSPTLKNDEKGEKPLADKDGVGGVDKPGDEDEVERRRINMKRMEDGIRVVSAFEGYAYDAGMRVGDKITKIDDFDIKLTTAVDEVRNHLRGDPGTPVSITIEREGVGGKVNEPQTIQLERSVVRIPDVKYFGFVGDPNDGIGYIDLSGFANDAGAEVRFAIRALQHGATEMAAAGNDDGPLGMGATDPTKLKGLVLDLRSNPGGLLTSAVDVATLFIPKGSDVVSAKGRGFPEILYRSVAEPALNPNTKLAVLVNEQTASAAEIVSGAIQDLDVGIIVGKGRTFGKGLVQNVQDLPYQTALKYTVAKYYTPSGRCIQSTVYEAEGSSPTGDDSGGAKYTSKKVSDKDRTVFLTAQGREVKDGGGVEVDYKVEPQKASPLEIILLRTGAYSDYAAEWSKNHELTNGFKVDDATYKDFQSYVEKRQKDGDMKLELLYDVQLNDLQKKLKASKLDSSSKALASLRADIIKDVKKDFTTYKDEITEDLEQNILARYLPDSMLIERGIKKDTQVIETAKMLMDGKQFNKILARDDNRESGQSYETTLTMKPAPTLQTRW